MPLALSGIRSVALYVRESRRFDALRDRLPRDTRSSCGPPSLFIQKPDRTIERADRLSAREPTLCAITPFKTLLLLLLLAWRILTMFERLRRNCVVFVVRFTSATCFNFNSLSTLLYLCLFILFSLIFNSVYLNLFYHLTLNVPVICTYPFLP